MTRQILDQIDEALEGQCACGCGALITAASPSAYFASPLCSARWHHVQHPTAVPATAVPGPRVYPLPWEEVLENWISMARQVSVAFTELLQALREAFAPAVESLHHLHLHLTAHDETYLCTPAPAPKHGPPPRRFRPPRAIAPPHGWHLEPRGR